MKKTLLILLLFIASICYSQVRPIKTVTIQNATTAFGEPISVADKVYNSDNQTEYTCITATASTGTLTTASANFTSGSGGSMTWPTSAGIALYSGSSSWGTSITNNSANWNTAYSDRLKWDGGSSSLNATTGRASLGLGTAAVQNVGYFATALQGSYGTTAYGWGNHASAGYQSELVSGTNIKTINGSSILGSGNLVVSGGAGTVTSVGGTGTVSGLTLTGTVTTSGNLTLGGTLSLTSGNVTGGLGYTPYNSTNPSGYTSFAEPGIFSGGGTPTLASGVTGAEVRSLIGAGTSSTAGTVTQVSNGNGMNFTNITGSGTVTLGTPTTLTATTTNAVTTSSHTHAITGFLKLTGGTVTGTITATDFQLSSDRRLKNNIRSLPIKKLNTNYKTFTFKNDKANRLRVGVIAQELKKTNPEFISTDENGMLAVSYTDVHSAEIAYLKQENERISAELKTLKSIVLKLIKEK